jgi:HD-GYP domain-containing protein (c-di-GMP phosphodiesterase class II)
MMSPDLTTRMPMIDGEGPKRAFLQQMLVWLFEPSRLITDCAQRRQARLLSALLACMIALALVLEALALALIDRLDYVGWQQTLAAVLLLGMTYAFSRTRYVQLTATLTVATLLAGVFVSAWYEPGGIKQGFLDFLILPLWLGSVFLDRRKLAILTAIVLVALLLFPLTTPAITLNDILIGPFTFTAPTSLLLLILTLHRDNLEKDRREELAEKEQNSRREAIRADALLRITERFNAQLDLDTVLAAICEEAARALGTTVAMASLYDRETNQFIASASVGMAPDVIQSLPPFPRAEYDQVILKYGPVYCIADLDIISDSAYKTAFAQGNLRSVAFASMTYEHELIGSLNVYSMDERREFTQDELLLLQGLARQAALALVNTTLYKDSHRRLDRLQALRSIDIAITSSRDLRETIHVLLEKLIEQLKVDAADFLLLNEERQHLEFTASHGFITQTLRFTRLRLGEGIAGRAAQQKKIIYISDLSTDPQTLAYAPSLAQEGFTSYFAVPMIAQGKVKGVLEIFHRSRLKPDEEWLAFLDALAGQAAIAIESSTLFAGLQHANREITQAYDSTIEGWSHALDLRDRETEGHTQRVTHMTLKLAQAMGLQGDDLTHIQRGALLHDIGKMGVPDTILLKPDALTPDEWEIMRKHPVYAFELLSPIAYLRPALDIPYCHHEKWDGSGYPRGLKGEEIPLPARIFAVVDVYDALTSDRPYRKAWTQAATLEHIRLLSGTHFEPKLVELFLQFMRTGFE